MHYKTARFLIDICHAQNYQRKCAEEYVGEILSVQIVLMTAARTPKGTVKSSQQCPRSHTLPWATKLEKRNLGEFKLSGSPQAEHLGSCVASQGKAQQKCLLALPRSLPPFCASCAWIRLRAAMPELFCLIVRVLFHCLDHVAYSSGWLQSGLRV